MIKLEKTQKENSDITEWILWFLQCLINAINATDGTLSKTLHKAEFWKTHSETILNDRQQKIINRFIDGFDEKLTTSIFDFSCEKEQNLKNKNVKKIK